MINKPNFVLPNPNDKQLHYQTYENLIRQARLTAGSVPSINNNNTVFGNHGPFFARITSVGAGNVTGIEYVWDGATEEWTELTGGREWDGTNMSYLIPLRDGIDIGDVDDVVMVFRVTDVGTSEPMVVWKFYNPKDTIHFQGNIDIFDEEVYFNDGEVFIGEASGNTVSDANGPWDINTDGYFYVKVTAPYDSTSFTVESSIQNSVSKPDFWDTSSTPQTLEINWIIGQISGGVYTQWYKGDVHMLFPFTPIYPSLVQGNSVNEAHRIGGDVETVGATKELFFDGQEYYETFLGGGLRNERAGDDLKWGGVTASPDIDYTSSIDSTQEDQVIFYRTNFDFETERGLVQSTDLDPQSPEILSARGWWIGIEVGAEWYHKPSPVESTSDERHWRCWTVDTTNCDCTQEIDGNDVDIVQMCVDDTNHVWYLNGTSSTPTNYKYRHCTDPITYSDVVLDSAAASVVIEVDDGTGCYEFLTETSSDTTGQAVSSTYATCTDCTGGLVNDVWYSCNSEVAVATIPIASSPTDDYAWLCIGGVYEKCYNAGVISGIGTAVAYLEQCDATPASCSDLIGWPASDDFSGTGCNSGSVGDTNWDVRWDSQTTAGNSSVVISGGKVDLSAGPNYGEVIIKDTQLSVTGDFTYSIDFTYNNPSSLQEVFMRMSVEGIPATYVGRRRKSGNERIVYRLLGGTESFISSSAGSGSFRIRRASGTVFIDYNTGGGWTNLASGANGGTVTTIRFDLYQDSGSSVTCSFDNAVMVDGSSNDIYVDPEFETC